MNPIEMSAIDSVDGWVQLEGYADGIHVRVLQDNLDEYRKTGRRTRLIRVDAGGGTEATLCHDYFEEVFIISGDLSSGGDGSGSWTYSYRPPGTPHGPFRTQAGCVLIEIQYYENLYSAAAI